MTKRRIFNRSLLLVIFILAYYNASYSYPGTDSSWAPLLQWVTDSSADILWRTNVLSIDTVFYGQTPDVPNNIITSLDSVHKVRLNNLLPATKYYYKVIRMPRDSVAYDSFYTSSVFDKQFKFLVACDNKRDGRINYICRDIKQYASDAKFLLSPGDIVNEGYSAGWNIMRKGTGYNKIIGNIPWIVTIGNHESWHHDTPNGPLVINFYQHFSHGDSMNSLFEYRWGNVVTLGLRADDEDDPQQKWPNNIAAQTPWLEQHLIQARNDPTVDWIFVQYHALTYTFGTGHWDHPQVNQYWVPLFDQYHVDAQFSGHNHMYERSVPIKGGKYDPDGTVYFTVGTFGTGHSGIGADTLLAKTDSIWGYLQVSIDGGKAEFKMIKAYPPVLVHSVIDSFVIEKPSFEFPLIKLTPSQLAFNAQVGGSNPVPAIINVTNAGIDTLDTADAQVTYTQGQSTGWLSVSRTSGGASLNDQRLLNTVNITSLSPDTYTATVTVVVANAENSPETYSVTLVVQDTAVSGIIERNMTVAAHRVSFTFAVPAAFTGKDISAKIITVDGRIVKKMTVSVSGRYISIDWDGKTANSVRAASGVYYLTVDFGDRTISAKTIFF